MARDVKVLTMPVFLRDALKKIALVEGKSQSQVVRDAVGFGISQYQGSVKPNDETVEFCFRIDPGDHDRVREISQEQYTTVNGLINLYLEEYLRNNNVMLWQQKKDGSNGPKPDTDG